MHITQMQQTCSIRAHIGTWPADSQLADAGKPRQGGHGGPPRSCGQLRRIDTCVQIGCGLLLKRPIVDESDVGL